MLNNSKICYPVIRSHMGRLNINKTQMQSILSMSYPTLISRLYKKSDWTSTELLIMAKLFECTVDDLLTE